MNQRTLRQVIELLEELLKDPYGSHDLEADALYHLRHYEDMLNHPAKMIEWLRQNSMQKR